MGGRQARKMRLPRPSPGNRARHASFAHLPKGRRTKPGWWAQRYYVRGFGWHCADEPLERGAHGASVARTWASRVAKSGSSPASRQPRQEGARRGFRVERFVQAEADDLGQRLVEPQRRQQHLGFLRRQQSGLAGRGKHRLGLGRNELRVLGGVISRSACATNSTSTSPPGACLRSQTPSPPFTSSTMARISSMSATVLPRSRRVVSDLADLPSSPSGRAPRRRRSTRARVSAMRSQVQASLA